MIGNPVENLEAFGPETRGDIVKREYEQEQRTGNSWSEVGVCASTSPNNPVVMRRSDNTRGNTLQYPIMPLVLYVSRWHITHKRRNEWFSWR